MARSGSARRGQGVQVLPGVALYLRGGPPLDKNSVHTGPPLCHLVPFTLHCLKTLRLAQQTSTPSHPCLPCCRRPFSLQDADHMLFHAPYNKLVQKAFARLTYIDYCK